MMLPSGNDAAHTLAEYFGRLLLEKRRYSAAENNRWDGLLEHTFFWANKAVMAFLKEMNRNARRLGMYDTYYDSPHGLSNERNFSTVYDICLLTHECMKIQVYRQVVGTRVFECKALNEQKPEQ